MFAEFIDDDEQQFAELDVSRVRSRVDIQVAQQTAQ